MITRWPTLLLLGGLFLNADGVDAAPASVRLSRMTDTFFVEDDQVYARCLWFQRDGTYRQINDARTNSEEVDRGTWEQSAGGDVVLHPTNGMLTYRALSAGPLLVTLTAQAEIDTLPLLRGRIARFLQTYQDQVFASTALADLATGESGGGETGGSQGASVLLPDRVETLSRSDLENLLRDVDVWLTSKRANAFVFDPVALAGGPMLLIQRGAVFSRAELPAAGAQVQSNKAPPFYFAQVSRQVFFQRVGTWRPFENLGGLHAPATGSKIAP